VTRLSFIYRTGLSCPYQEMPASGNFSPPEPVVDASFIVQFSVASFSRPIVTGTFSAHTDASGEIVLSHKETAPSYCEEKVDETWTATWVEAATMKIETSLTRDGGGD